MLLGRPWQRGNYISIDEHGDRTYLLFKNQDLEVQHKILVALDRSDSIWMYNPMVALGTHEGITSEQQERADTLTCTTIKQTDERTEAQAKSTGVVRSNDLRWRGDSDQGERGQRSGGAGQRRNRRSGSRD